MTSRQVGDVKLRRVGDSVRISRLGESVHVPIERVGGVKAMMSEVAGGLEPELVDDE